MNNRKETLKQYLIKLYEILNKNNACFLKGAFVINDTNNKLKPLLYYNISTESNIKQKLLNMTHNKYLKVNTNISEIHFKNPLILNCINDTSNPISFKNIKFYVFGPNTKYVFLKLETNPTLSLPHFIRKSSMILKNNIEKINIKSRREDCYKYSFIGKGSDPCVSVKDIDISNSRMYKMCCLNIDCITEDISSEVIDWYNNKNILYLNNNVSNNIQQTQNDLHKMINKEEDLLNVYATEPDKTQQIKKNIEILQNARESIYGNEYYVASAINNYIFECIEKHSPSSHSKKNSPSSHSKKNSPSSHSKKHYTGGKTKKSKTKKAKQKKQKQKKQNKKSKN